MWRRVHNIGWFVHADHDDIHYTCTYVHVHVAKFHKTCMSYQSCSPDLDVAAGEDALVLVHHPLQPVLIDCVEEVNDGSLLEAQLLFTATFKGKQSSCLLPWRRLERWGERE